MVWDIVKWRVSKGEWRNETRGRINDTLETSLSTTISRLFQANSNITDIPVCCWLQSSDLWLRVVYVHDGFRVVYVHDGFLAYTSIFSKWDLTFSRRRYEDDCLLGCSAVQSRGNWPTFQISSLDRRPDDRSIKHLWNVSQILQDYMTHHPITQTCAMFFF